MESLYNNYLEKEISDIRNLLEGSTQLTLQSRIALQKVISNKFSSSTFDPDLIQRLDESISREHSKIKNLKTLDWLGIDLFEENDSVVIKKSNTAQKRDVLGLIIGALLLIVFLSAGVLFWLRALETGLNVMQIIPAALTTIIGVWGFLLVIRTIDRIAFYKGFAIVKNNNGIDLYFRPNKELEKREFSMNSKICLYTNDSETELSIEEDDSKVVVLVFKKLGFQNMESLESLIAEFNKN